MDYHRSIVLSSDFKASLESIERAIRTTQFVTRDVVEPVAAGVIAISLEFYTIWFLNEGSQRCQTGVERSHLSYWFKHVQHPKGHIKVGHVLTFETFEVGK